MSQAATQPETNYYATLNRLFAVTTGTVLLLCLISLPFFPLNQQDTMLFIGILGASTIFTIIKYYFLKSYITYDQGFYITDILNPIMTGMLIDVSGRYGLYLYFIFFLQILGSLALLRFRHVLVGITMISGYSIYLFFISDTFELSDPERYAAGLIILVILFLITIFSYVIIQELVRMVADLQNRKSMFIQDVSHELRTPLTVIKGVTGVLKEGRLPASDKKGWPGINLLEHLRSAAEDLENITEKLSVQSRQKMSADERDKVVTTISKTAPAKKKKNAKKKSE